MGIAKEGAPFIVMPLALAAAFLALFAFGFGGWALVPGVIFGLITLFCLFFFRDPRIVITEGENLLLSPCNGTVMEIVETENEKVVRIFLSIFNVHLQRAPAAGIVRSVEHRAGEFLMAMHPEAFLRNEQNVITIESPRGVFTVRQIAGFLARRCVAWVKEGDTLVQGQKIGLIKFSSQVDAHFPRTAALSVQKGDKVISGVTVLGEWK
jgi:phosphatidylserine decarboxylase